MCIILQNKSQVIRVRLCGVHHTVESTAPNFSKNSAVCIPPRSRALQCASHRRVRLRGVHHTEESNCTPWSQNQNLCESLVGLKGTVGRNPFRCEHILLERKDLRKKILFAKTNILTPQWDAHRRVEFFYF